MIIYHCITTYHLLELMVHSLRYSRNKTTICLLPEFLYDQIRDKIVQIEQWNLFSQVRCLRYRRVPHDENYLQNIENAISILDIDFDAVTDIHVAGAQYYFSSYLIEKHHRFCFWEEAAGVVTRPEPVENIVKGISEHQYIIAKKNGMFTGDNEYVDKVYCNYAAQTPGFFPDEKTVDYNVVNEMALLDDDDFLHLKCVFDVPSNIVFGENTALFMTQHFANLNMMTLDDQIQLYQSTIDYYLNDKNIVFKTHPNDLCYYSQLFPNSTVIRTRFPSEFLPYISKTKPKIIAAISSTGVRNIADEYDQVLLFTPNYEKEFRNNNKYYLMLTIIDIICENSPKRLFTAGIDRIQLKNMLDFSDIDLQIEFVESIEEASVCILDGSDGEAFSIHDFDKRVDLVLLDERLLYLFDQDVIVPKTIKKDVMRSSFNEELYSNLDTETVYFISNNDERRQAIRKMNYEKELYCMNIHSYVSELSDAETKIAVLEGILESTQKRLDYYIKREKELLEEINKTHM